MKPAIAFPALFSVLALALPAGAADAPRPTEPFRQEHVGIREHLGHVDQMSADLQGMPAEKQRETMAFMVRFLKEHIVPHAQWEEKVLYPAVDKRAAKGANPFTATMRHEHTIVGRWIGELEAELAKPEPDVKRFARRADYVLGLIVAHFELEEEVLLPVLDKSMTPAQFEKEIGKVAHDAPPAKNEQEGHKH